jgi:hypothetical protein
VEIVRSENSGIAETEGNKEKSNVVVGRFQLEILRDTLREGGGQEVA